MLNNEIIPMSSIGGISLGDNVDSVINLLRADYDLEENANSIAVDDGLITIYFNENKRVVTEISCNRKFKGKYSNKLWPGMTVADVIKNTQKQIAWSGFVEVDGIKGIGLSLPEDRDDFENITDFLDLDFVFEELWVYSF